MGAKGQRPRVAVFGLFGSGNMGNDATLEAMLQGLRAHAPEAELFCIVHDPAYVTATYGPPAVSIYQTRETEGGLVARLPGPLRRLVSEAGRWARARTALKGADHILFAGTGMYEGSRTTALAMPLWLLRWTAMARSRGARAHIVAMGAGHVSQSWARRFFRWAARLARWRSWRNAPARSFMVELGVDAGKDDIVPDLVFALATDIAADPPAGEVASVGLGVMGFHDWLKGGGDEAHYRAYIAKLAQFARWLIDEGKSVRILFGDGEDAQVVADLKAAIGDHDALAARAMSTIHDVFAEIAATDAVVASRFHNLIPALRLGKPCVSLGYGEKFRALMADFGVGALCQDIWDFDLERLKSDFLQATRDAPAFHAAARQRSDEHRAALDAHFADIARRIRTGA